jgi:hypothetical protein
MVVALVTYSYLSTRILAAYSALPPRACRLAAFIHGSFRERERSMRGRIKAGILVLVCAAALGVAGCGGDDDETTTTTSSTTTTTGATGATGAEDTTTGEDTDAPEGTAEIQGLLETAFTAQGLTASEATCVSELVAPTVAGESIDKLQDPAYVQGLLEDQKEDIENCEGQ